MPRVFLEHHRHAIADRERQAIRAAHQHLGGALEATLVVGGTLAACVLGHEFVRRVPVLRPLFGLKAKRPSGRPHPEALAVVGGSQ